MKQASSLSIFHALYNHTLPEIRLTSIIRNVDTNTWYYGMKKYIL